MRVLMVADHWRETCKPFIAFGRVLADSQHQVHLCTSGRFQDDCRQHGLHYWQMPDLDRRHYQEFYSRFLNLHGDEEAALGFLGRYVGEICSLWGPAVYRKVQELEIDIFITHFRPLAFMMERTIGVYTVVVCTLMPATPTRDFPYGVDVRYLKAPDAIEPGMRVSLRGSQPPSDANWESYVYAGRLFHEGCSACVRAVIRQHSDDLDEPTTLHDIECLRPDNKASCLNRSPSLRSEDGRETARDGVQPLRINAFSRCWFAETLDYGPASPIVGAWSFSISDLTSYKPPPQLAAFLARCRKPPVVIAANSPSGVRLPEQRKNMLQALKEYDSQHHYIVWSDEELGDQYALPDSLLSWVAQHVCVISEMEEDWLLPKCSMAVHRGDAVLTHACARAAVVQVVLPMTMMHRIWGFAVEERGVGVFVRQGWAGIHEISPWEFADALRAASAPGIVEAAAQLQRDIAREGDGRRAALTKIEQMHVELQLS